jgi:hypothetical protein
MVIRNAFSVLNFTVNENGSESEMTEEWNWYVLLIVLIAVALPSYDKYQSNKGRKLHNPWCRVMLPTRTEFLLFTKQHCPN